jgi:hypothetical protein
VNDTKYPARLRKFYQSWGGAFMPLMVTNFLAAPCHIYRDGVNGTPVVNVSALSHMYDPVGSDDKGGRHNCYYGRCGGSRTAFSAWNGGMFPENNRFGSLGLVDFTTVDNVR